MELFFFGVGTPKETEQAPDRDIDEKTKRLVSRVAQGLLRSLPRKTKAELWTTVDPYLNAYAALVAEELGVKRKYTRTIAESRIQAILDLAAEHARDRCLIIVADTENIATWVKEISGLQFPLQDLSILAFLVDTDEGGPSELLWFSQSNITQRLH